MGTAAVQSGQTNKIHYIAKYKIGNSGVLATLNTETAASTGPFLTGDVPSGNIHLDVSISETATSNTLIAGTYTDSLHVDISPNP